MEFAPLSSGQEWQGKSSKKMPKIPSEPIDGALKLMKKKTSSETVKIVPKIYVSKRRKQEGKSVFSFFQEVENCWIKKICLSTKKE